MSRMRAAAGVLLFVAMLIGCAMTGGNLVLKLLDTPALAAMEAERSAIAQWPELPATLYRLTLVRTRTGRSAGAIYVPEVLYRYRIGTRTYFGSRLSLDGSWRWLYQAQDPRDFRLIVAALAPGVDFRTFLDAPQCRDLAAYESCRVDYDLEQPIGVRVDPRDPGRSAMEAGALTPATVFNHLLPPLAWIACALAALLASAASALWMLQRLVVAEDAGDTPDTPFPVRLWHIAGGLLSASLAVESYILTLDWRTAPASAAELMGWMPGTALCAALALFGLYLVFQPQIDRRIRRSGHRGRRRRTA